MPDFSVDDIEIEPWEFVSACSRREKKELVEALINDDEVYDDSLLSEVPRRTGGRGYDAYEFEQAVDKLTLNYHSLSKEQIDIIINLAKRF
jgi:hypothetical protein